MTDLEEYASIISFLHLLFFLHSSLQLITFISTYSYYLYLHLFLNSIATSFYTSYFDPCHYSVAKASDR